MHTVDIFSVNIPEQVEPDVTAGHQRSQDSAHTTAYGEPRGARQPEEHSGPGDYPRHDEYPRHEEYHGPGEYPGAQEYPEPDFYYPETPNLLKRRFDRQQEGYNSPNYGEAEIRTGQDSAGQHGTAQNTPVHWTHCTCQQYSAVLYSQTQDSAVLGLGTQC